MKKISALLLAVLLMISAAACGDKTAPGETTEPSAYLPTEQSQQMPVQEQEAPSAPLLPEPEVTEPATTEPPLPQMPEPRDADFVPVLAYIPDALVELKYAADDNFTGQVIYDFSTCFLRYGTVKKLMDVQRQLSEHGLRLKIWDGFRPVSAQFVLWEVCPDPVYVANPQTGFSSHSRGNTVDLTLVDSAGNELTMPTGFDDFSALADRDYSDCPEEAARNALYLQQVMEAAGFTGYYGEWWHFSDTVQYPVEDLFTPVAASEHYAMCEEFITLRTGPDITADEILKIPVDHTFIVLAICDDFYYVNYRGLFGYVLAAYTAPVEN